MLFVPKAENCPEKPILNFEFWENDYDDKPYNRSRYTFDDQLFTATFRKAQHFFA